MTKAISNKISDFMKAGSFIRKMFEDGIVLKAKYGADKVCDFSLGNPMGEPPVNFLGALKYELENPTPGMHGYMPNGGYPYVREALAKVLSAQHGVTLNGKNIIMTVGAAGALNVALKALVNPGETILIFAPYFLEYRFYADNVNAQARIVETDNRFDLDMVAIRKALDPGVKALILNTPNNPTGRIYSHTVLTELAALLEEKSKEFGHPIYILSDEPYKRIVFGNMEVPSLLKIYRNALICTSFSKEMSIPGERLGYIAPNPDNPDIDEIVNALTFCNRILGFVNAPALMQRALGRAPDAFVDIAPYRENRDLLTGSLKEMGYDLIPPDGAFYLFPKSPIEDETVFTDELRKELILVVPGRGFGRAGYFRIAFCVKKEMIERSLPGFKRAIERVKR